MSGASAYRDVSAGNGSLVVRYGSRFRDGTPLPSRVHIGIFGRRNAGKSSLINAIAGQDVAVVSPVPGTTTDPVYRPMEIPGAGPVVLVDTPGIDDEGELGTERVRRALRVLRKTDLAVLVLDAAAGIGEPENRVIQCFRERSVPAIFAINKTDLVSPDKAGKLLRQVMQATAAYGSPASGTRVLNVSALTGSGVRELVEEISARVASLRLQEEPPIVGDLLEPGDLVVLVTPTDVEAPKGRLILPQVQTLRDILDHDAVGVCLKVPQLRDVLERLPKPPRLVITDSQVFPEVNEVVPRHIPLTSFSILFARYKGDLGELVRGVRSLEKLKPGDKVLISEACTHHPVEDDIATVKIPRWLRQKTGGELEFSWSRGASFPENLGEYEVVVHCGGCMLNRREMLARIGLAKEAGVPVTNYGLTIAWATGILDRVLEPFSPDP